MLHIMNAKFCRLKPIFHCNAKKIALGTFASPNAKDSTFALPNAKNTNMLVSLTQNPQRESVEYRLCWVSNALAMYISCWLCQFHLR